MLAELANKKKEVIPPELLTELPNFQQQSKLLNPLGTVLYKCTSLKKPEAPLAYTVRSLPWTHAVHFHYIPYEVYENKDKLLVTVAKVKSYESSQVSLFQAKIAVEFEKGVFPINITEFMTNNGFLTPGVGMKVARTEMLKTLDNLIHPTPTEPEPEIPAETEHELPAEPEPVPEPEPVVAKPKAKSAPRPAAALPAPPKPAAALPAPRPAAALPLTPVAMRPSAAARELIAFIDFMDVNNIIKFDAETMLNEEGKAEFEKEVLAELDDSQKEMVSHIRKNKRFLSETFFTHLPPAVKRVCSYH